MPVVLMKKRFIGISALMLMIVVSACATVPDDNNPLPTLAALPDAETSPALITEEPAIVATDVLLETEEPEPTPAETEEAVLSTEEPPAPETDEPSAPATDESTGDEVSVNLPPVDLDAPLPPVSADEAYYLAASYATVETGINEDPASDGQHFVMTTVTLGNQSGATVTVGQDDLFLIGEDGERYAAVAMAERVSPALIGTTLAETDSVYGFALFAMPVDVEPVLFEWCPGGACDAQPLQGPISLQN